MTMPISIIKAKSMPTLAQTNKNKLRAFKKVLRHRKRQSFESFCEGIRCSRDISRISKILGKHLDSGYNNLHGI